MFASHALHAELDDDNATHISLRRVHCPRPLPYRGVLCLCVPVPPRLRRPPQLRPWHVARHVGFTRDVSVCSPNVAVKSAPVRWALRRHSSGRCKASASSAAAGSSASPATSSSPLLDLAASVNQEVPSSSAYIAPSSSSSSNQVPSTSWYYAGLGACGWTDSGVDYVAVISSSFFDNFE
ncbi:hypothetical protein FISHEDRAFT_79063 [Fistulina hepatica ATCC 64428]|uniref:Uncharacterized protein n=1 Tax=Fistulina hepatica ATCC 64428 TaxID=1128425 RepID=A0A0D6ZYG1_9AGAR|nr:hypothetical protein FISHEDRAFT_79063 [Fistulina hepatica ATCC 64428]